MDSAAISLANHGKLRCGDFWGFREFENGNLSVGCVSDGVSGAAKDWLASQLTIDTFFATFTSLGNLPIEKRLSAGVDAADKRVRQAYESGEHRMLATCVAVAWNSADKTISWITCGDSRLYGIRWGKLEQMSVDHSKPVIARGRDGKVLVSSGVLITRNGLTIAIGTLDNVPAVETCNTAGLEAVLLTTDGYYGCASFNEPVVTSMCSSLSLDTTFKNHETSIRDERSDDATVLVMRNDTVEPSVIKIIKMAIDSDADFSRASVNLFAARKVLRDELSSAIKNGNINRALSIVRYLEKYRLDLGKQALVALTEDKALKSVDGRCVLERIIPLIRSSAQ